MIQEQCCVSSGVWTSGAAPRPAATSGARRKGSAAGFSSGGRFGSGRTSKSRAEHHAVYDSDSGEEWQDITPSQVEDISHRLFLPDDSATYDFDKEGIRRNNCRLTLTDDILVQQFFKSQASRMRL
ncbi:hypothetical protein [Methylocystis sp.]|uniref:hypothetical protein n=1 Tax=Methylocystis sp. TaxID=1911079 RepID=UPI003DA47F6A